jgi:hypothetical protein
MKINKEVVTTLIIQAFITSLKKNMVTMGNDTELTTGGGGLRRPVLKDSGAKVVAQLCL